MPAWQSIAVGIGVCLAFYAALVAALVAAGRRTDARALAGFIPDCLVLCRRLLGDERIPRSRKLLVGVMIAYLALPLDLVPDFIPVAGQLDDAIVVALTLRAVVRASGPELLREHWPGPPAALEVVLRLAFGPAPPPAVSS